MADPFIAVGLHALPLAANHYEKVYNPIKRRYKRMRGQGPVYNDDDRHGGWKPDDRGLILKKRSEVESDEEIVEVLPRQSNRGALVRRTSSLDRGNYGNDRRDGRNDRRVGAYRGGAAGEASDSEGSVPPRSRQKSRGRAKSSSGKSRRGRSSSSSGSSDLGSTTDDEKRCRKARNKKWITGALAGVATIHAASKVYSSIESHDKRAQEVREGKLSPEENHKKQQQSHWQDAAAIAIAALGIKGAMSEWHEVQETQHEHQQMLESREQRHKRRMERQRNQAKKGATSSSGGGRGGGRGRGRDDDDDDSYDDRDDRNGGGSSRRSVSAPQRRQSEPQPQRPRHHIRKRDVARDWAHLAGEVVEEYI